MALLTADDVLNKKFQSVKFREGYDQVEVDEFLDEVVATIYALQVENGELKEKLMDAEVQLAEGVQAPAVEEPAAEPEPVVEEPAKPAQPEPAEAASSMLALAQRLHDEYVNEGREESERIVADAKFESERIIREAEENRDQVLADLDRQRTALEGKINDLRGFESEYRKGLSDHLHSLLDQVTAEND